MDIGNPARDGDRARVRKVYENLTQRELTNESLATYTGELFFAIVALTGDEGAMNLIRGANERLYYLRALECRYIDEDTASEFVLLCELALAGRHDDLKQTIITYHHRRRDLLPKLNEFLAAQ